MIRNLRRRHLLGAGMALTIGLSPTPPHALTVFDPLNYEQNLLSAIRALDSVGNQIRQLQNQAQALARMDRNLLPQSGSIAPQLQTTLSSLRAQVARGEALALTVRETDAAYQQMFPTSFSNALTGNEAIGAAKSRWDEAYASFKRAALLQGHVGDVVGSDGRLLDDILGRSQSAVGALQVSQAGNELTALGVKQALQLQTLIAAQYRAETSDRARSIVAQEEARQRFQQFLGDSRAYTPTR
jgi:P-type conjugative transfer protein TrbJ